MLRQSFLQRELICLMVSKILLLDADWFGSFRFLFETRGICKLIEFCELSKKWNLCDVCELINEYKLYGMQVFY